MIADEFDLDKHVVGKPLDGLFFILGQEEMKIRANPAAQTTALLKEVFRQKMRVARTLPSTSSRQALSAAVVKVDTSSRYRHSDIATAINRE
jgi:hypothetical protein